MMQERLHMWHAPIDAIEQMWPPASKSQTNSANWQTNNNFLSVQTSAFAIDQEHLRFVLAFSLTIIFYD